MSSATQPDPIGLAGGLNLYGYAGGDPVNFSDPFGLCAKNISGSETLEKCRHATAAESERVHVAAQNRMRSHQDAGVTYEAVRPMPAGRDDCSNFCDGSTAAAGFDVPAHSTRDYAGSKYYERTFHPRKGDIMWQPGPNHVGVFTGEYNANGNPLGTQMGVKAGASVQPWGVGGAFQNGDKLVYYRLLVPR